MKNFEEMAIKGVELFGKFNAELKNYNVDSQEVDFNIHYEPLPRLYVCVSIENILCDHKNPHYEFKKFYNREMTFYEDPNARRPNTGTMFFTKYYTELFTNKLIKNPNPYECFIEVLEQFFDNIIEEINDAVEQPCDCEDCLLEQVFQLRQATEINNLEIALNN